MNLTFKGKYIISGKIVCKTGLHIGGATEGFEVGGLDNPVIKDPLTEQPYIPGSSLKGKLRHLLEWKLGPNTYNNEPHHFTPSKREAAFGPCSCGRCEACVIFGVTPQAGVKEEDKAKALGFATRYVPEEAQGESYRLTGPTRLTVRDVFPTEETKEEWKQWLGEKVYTELKTENALDRVTSEANPRTMERVPAGSKFEFEMIFDVYADTDKDLLKEVFAAMHLLGNSALGGSGSRGSGKVEFADLSIEFRPVTYYQTGNGQRLIDLMGSITVQQILTNFGAIDWGI